MTDPPVDIEDAEDALVDGDRAFEPGTAMSALRHRDFRLVWGGSMLSNVGTWMQNVALGVFGYKLTHSPNFVALLGFAQLGPLLLLAPLGGALADSIDRKRLVVFAQVEQLVLSLVLAWVARAHHPSKTALVACVLAIGVGNALNAPAFSSILPALVPRRDLAGAVSLQSVQMNASRVIGPAIGGLILPIVKPSGVFAINAATYIFAVAGVLVVRIPRVRQTGEQGLRRLAGGFAVARRDPFVRRCLITIASISFFCLPFIGLMPVLADRSFHIDTNSAAYGLLNACFGLGAAVGATAVGSVLIGRSKVRLVRGGLLAFAFSLAAFALVRTPWPSYPIGFLVGFFYFVTITSLSTLLQRHLDDNVRGRVMALWIMGFGGTVPLGLLVGGAVASRTSITAVLLAGAVVAVVLSTITNLQPTRATGDMARGR